MADSAVSVTLVSDSECEAESGSEDDTEDEETQNVNQTSARPESGAQDYSVPLASNGDPPADTWTPGTAGIDYPHTRLSPNAGPEFHRPSSDEVLTDIFDFRQAHNQFIRGCSAYIPLDRARANSLLQSDGHTLVEYFSPFTLGRLIVIGTNKKCILIKTKDDVFCLTVDANTRENHVESCIRQMVFGSAVNQHVQTAPQILTLVSNGQRIITDKVLTLPDCAGVEAVIVECVPIVWRIAHRPTWDQEVMYDVPSTTTASLAETKQRFLQRLLQDTDKPVGIAVWFSVHNRLLTTEVFREICDIYFLNYANGHQPHYDDFKLTAHFQPPNAIPVQLVFQPNRNDIAKAIKVIVIPPQISANGLRHEVSKAICQDPASFQIIINRKKLNHRLDIRKALSSPNCTIMVKHSSQMLVEVNIVDSSDHRLLHKYRGFVYPHKLLSTLKKDICNILRFPKPHCMDVQVEGRWVLETRTLKENHIEDGDNITCLIFTNRICLSVRSPSYLWHDIIVDDLRTTLVGDVKRFVLQIEGGCRHECTIKTVLDNTMVSDTDTLGNAGISPEQGTARLVLVPVECVVFTASTSYKGTLVVFQDTGKGCFQLVVASSGIRKLHYDDCPSFEDVQELVLQRNGTTSKDPVQGMRVCSEVEKEMFQTAPSVSTSNRGANHTTPPVRKSQCTQTASALECAAQAPTKSSSAAPEKEQTLEADPEQSTAGSNRRQNSNQSPSRPESRETTTGSRQKCKTGGHVRFSLDESEMPSTSSCDAGFKEICHKATAPVSAVDGNWTEVRSSVFQPSKLHTSLHHSLSCPGSSTQTVVSTRKRPIKSSSAPLISQPCHFFSASSDSEDPHGQREFRRRRKIGRSTTLRESFHENPDGTWTKNQLSESETSLPADIGEQEYHNFMQLQQMPPRTSSTPSASTVVPFNPCLSIEPFYKYIDASILTTVAKYLGAEAMMVMRELQVTEDAIQQANEEHPKNPVERHFSCLKSWCQKFGAQANKEVLKNALRKHDRNDLVEKIDEIDAIDLCE